MELEGRRVRVEYHVISESDDPPRRHRKGSRREVLDRHISLVAATLLHAAESPESYQSPAGEHLVRLARADLEWIKAQGEKREGVERTAG